MAADLQKLIRDARQLLNNGDVEDALQLLSQYSESPEYTDNCLYLNILGESLLENSQVDEAYSVYNRSIQLDPNGEISVDPYFTLGQIIGGKEGLQLIQKGVDILSSNSSSKTADHLKKIIKAIFSQIEIWMTDLCMEPEAESQCESLIREALSLDSENPETYSLLASIQISQSKTEDAKQNLNKSWELFSEKKQKLEDSADSRDVSETDSAQEYIDLIQPLLTLAKFSIEVGLFDLGATISSNIHDISDDLLEPFYLEAFSHYLAAKTLQYDLSHNNNNKGAENNDEDRETRLQNIYDMPLSINEDGSGLTDEITNYIVNAVCALVNGDKVLYADETADEEVKQQMKVLVDELGGKKAFKRVQALNKSDGSTVTEENWEQHI